MRLSWGRGSEWEECMCVVVMVCVCVVVRRVRTVLRLTRSLAWSLSRRTAVLTAFAHGVLRGDEEIYRRSGNGREVEK